ncbi:hypothetical protein CAMGR0001_1151 [Campylobacter gracilis RM3268]|uniref:Uncharacterized protein n=1 Tax=Campylobacter gracilis RM3268 TaxID=553220 RepID=C8PIV2_9BACT|nr:hypothetical protein CAMGR0001_1151 [Campylobacter gracilis RM3268]
MKFYADYGAFVRSGRRNFKILSKRKRVGLRRAYRATAPLKFLRVS